METLASLIERDGGLQEADAVGWAIRLARTVEEIHQRGLVHGRLSAASLQVSAAECSSEGELVALVDLPENVAYHSPDRERGEGGSQADDTWAVAVVLYYALSGSLPFSGASDDEVRRKIRTVPAPPLAVFDVGDDELQAIVDRALARSREGRTVSVAGLRAELESWQPELQLQELPPLLQPFDADEEVTMVHSGRAEDIRSMLRQVLAEGAEDATVRFKPPRKKGDKPAAAKPEPAAEPVATPPLAAAPVPSVGLTGLVDEASAGDDDDPFAVPASRAEVRATGTHKSLPPPAPKAPVATGRVAPPSPDAKPATAQTPRETVDEGMSRGRLIAILLAVLAALAGVAYLATQEQAPTNGRLDPAAKPTEPPIASSIAAASAPSVIPASPSASSQVGGQVGGQVGAPSGGHDAGPSAQATMGTSSPRGDVASCVLSLFPPESFDAQSNFAPVCAETDPLKLGNALRAELVRARKNLSEGMRDWALLGWYELPAVALVRARCCPSAQPLDIPALPACPPMAEVLGELVGAAGKTHELTDKSLQAALTAYTNEVYCLVRYGHARRFGRTEGPEGGQDTTFLRFLRRFVKA